MAQKKRVTRKQLLKEPDEFLTFSAKAILFATNNKKQIAFALVGLLIVVLALAGFRYFSILSDRKAYAVFEQGLRPYLDQISKGELPAFEETAGEKFEEVLKDHPSTSGGRLSLLLYADINYHKGAYDKAIELYQRVVKAFEEEAIIRILAWNGLAYAFEGKKDYKTAAQFFEKIIEAKGAFMKADAYFNMGRMHEALEHREKALAAYEKVVQDYPESIHFQVAKDKVVFLKGQGF